MITVTRLKGQVIAINPDHVDRVEELPDTTLRLTSGEVLLVRESLDEIVEKVIAYRRAVFGPAPIEKAIQTMAKAS